MYFMYFKCCGFFIRIYVFVVGKKSFGMDIVYV